MALNGSFMSINSFLNGTVDRSIGRTRARESDPRDFIRSLSRWRETPESITTGRSRDTRRSSEEHGVIVVGNVGDRFKSIGTPNSSSAAAYHDLFHGESRSHPTALAREHTFRRWTIDKRLLDRISMSVVTFDLISVKARIRGDCNDYVDTSQK